VGPAASLLVFLEPSFINKPEYRTAPGVTPGRLHLTLARKIRFDYSPLYLAA
jgi:hypothetical protein